MDADAGHLQKFMDVPYVMEAPAAQGGLLGAAASALARKGVRVRLDDTNGLGSERYREMVEGIRRDLQANLAPTAGYAIDVFDISRPDADGELAKIHPSLRGGGKNVRKLNATKGAFASGFMTPDMTAHCIVVGFRPDMPVDPILARGMGRAAFPRGALDDAAFHRITMVHEVGHCLLGASEAKADAFAALMVLRDPAFPKEALSRWANWREREEWTLSVTEDDHFAAKGFLAVIERADALRADPTFAGLDVEGVASLADAIVEGRGMGAEEEAEVASVRRAMRAAVLSVAPRAGLAEGATPILGWLWAHRDIAAVDRIVAVLDDAAAGTDTQRPFTARPGEFRAAIGALAASGDRIAKVMAKGYDARPRTDTAHTHEVASNHGGVMAKVIPYRFKRTAYEGRVVAYSPEDGPRIPPSAMSAALEDAAPSAPGFR